MSDDQKKILIWGGDRTLMRIVEQRIKNTPELTNFAVFDQVEYGHTSIVTADMLRSADIVLYGLFCRHGKRLRAEGIPALGVRLRAGKLGLVYCVGLTPVLSNPLVLDIISNTLITKLTNLDRTPNLLDYWEKLNAYFTESIFPVDGHTY